MKPLALVDRALAPIRQQIAKLVPPAPVGAGTRKLRVLDVACGTGDQLWQLYDKIEFGLGIDVNEASIHHAKRRLVDAYGEDSSSRIEYRIQDLQDFLKDTGNDSNSTSSCMLKFDVVMATLFFHILPWEDAVANLLQMTTLLAPDGFMIVGAFVEADNWRDRVLLWLDQRCTHHYTNFQNYLAKGGMVELVGECNIYHIDRVLDTNDDTIKIFVLKPDPNWN